MRLFASLLVALAVAALNACGTTDTGPGTPVIPVIPQPPLEFSRIAAGDAHTCGLAADGGVYCWGLGSNATLGSDTLLVATRPVRVSGTPGNVTDIVAGGASTCVLTADTATYCWGAGSHGQLGNGTRANRSQPTRVLTDTPFVRVSLGAAHACGLTRDGRPFCWGGGDQGELGSALIADTAKPYTRVGWSQLYSSVGAGGHHVCGIILSGAAWCWGWNRYGQLGIGGTVNFGLPEPVAGGVRFSALALGAEHTCALATTGDTYCWGHGNAGQLGTGKQQDALVPSVVAGSARLTALSAGGQHTCGLTADGTAYCWGSNFDGQLGTGTKAGLETSPVQVSTTLKFKQIVAAARHTCALGADNKVYCWGFGGLGQLGNGLNAQAAVPTAVVHP